MTRFILAFALASLSSSAFAQQADPSGPQPYVVPEAPADTAASADDDAPARFQAGVSVLATMDFIGAGNGDEIIDIPSYIGVGADVHLGALLSSWTGFNGVRFSLLAGYRGNVETKFGVFGIGNDMFTQRHQAYLAFAGNHAEIAIGGGAVFTTLFGDSNPRMTGRGGSLLAELRAGTRSGFTVSVGMNADLYTDLVRHDGSKVRAVNLFVGLGWKTL